MVVARDLMGGHAAATQAARGASARCPHHWRVRAIQRAAATASAPSCKLRDIKLNKRGRVRRRREDRSAQARARTSRRANRSPARARRGRRRRRGARGRRARRATCGCEPRVARDDGRAVRGTTPRSARRRRSDDSDDEGVGARHDWTSDRPGRWKSDRGDGHCRVTVRAAPPRRVRRRWCHEWARATFAAEREGACRCSCGGHDGISATATRRAASVHARVEGQRSCGSRTPRRRERRQPASKPRRPMRREKLQPVGRDDRRRRTSARQGALAQRDPRAQHAQRLASPGAGTTDRRSRATFTAPKSGSEDSELF